MSSGPCQPPEEALGQLDECRPRKPTRVLFEQRGKSKLGAPARDPLVGARGYREHAAELWLGGDAAGAVAEWQKALKATVEERGRVPEEELDEFEQSVQLNLAAGHLRLGQHSEAKKHASASIWLKPSCPKGRYRLAEACAKLGDWEEAEAAAKHLEEAGREQLASHLRRLVQDCRKDARKQEKEMATRMLGAQPHAGDSSMAGLDSMD
ncbi:unnamed protein product [Effrenium voratum]|uniref:Uncharacterized protein n=1 Tax=Effrenium voratum TaxID=2562239 RepID=A0AA36JCC5_9DINO|nr:unnamed protein product [Effrenium voratum]CAJ1448209.1 unnamed protein product [Effrenium voratum]